MKLITRYVFPALLVLACGPVLAEWELVCTNGESQETETVKVVSANTFEEACDAIKNDPKPEYNKYGNCTDKTGDNGHCPEY